MNKMLTGLTVWTLFLVLMGVFFPIPTTTDLGIIGKILQSITIYGFFSLTPIVFYGSIVSLASDWLARRIKWHFQPLSFFFHIAGACTAYIVTQNIDITLMAVLAAVLFFVADRFFMLLKDSSQRFYLVKNLPIVLGFVGVTIMVFGSSFV
ncbi:hypothetical protein [Alteribacillus bidgolensis]|uniref:DUF3429 domain-containing protein n=1 Tax=Alteribacillus bidgolensis TaxID=930129 RepID=A0A1G8MH83_9BACI|nr:hypothetical protein [Alteribacillus bidgolensis]SDI67311.1 hypothetical protein SAMN05216352_11042 [Alteribacillus bidgolensis]